MYYSILIIFITSILSAVNLIKNPSFENGTIGPWIEEKADIEINKKAYNGFYSAKLYRKNEGTGYAYQTITLLPNFSYSVSVFIYDPSTKINACIKIKWLNETNTAIGEEKSSLTKNSFNWQYLNLTSIKPPKGTEKANVGIEIKTENSWEYILFDEFALVELGEISTTQKEKPFNYPNPFNLKLHQFTKIKIPRHILDNEIKIEIFNICGEHITSLNNSTWNGRDKNGNFIETGIYFYKIKTANGNTSGRIIVIR